MSHLDDEASQPLRPAADEDLRDGSHTAVPPSGSTGSSNGDGLSGHGGSQSEARRGFMQRKGSAAQGSLANMLPVLEDSDASEALLADASPTAEPSEPSTPRSRTASEMSFDVDFDSDFEDASTYNFLPGSKGKSRTPGDIRTAVLEWMYEEKDQEQCSDLCLANAKILEDLISVFVNVVLHGKSDVIRSQVWRFLIQASVSSLHFAFLVICSLNASCHQNPAVEEDELSSEFKKKRAQNLAAVEKIIDTISKESLAATNKASNLIKDGEADTRTKSAETALETVRSSLDKVLQQLEDVHDSQVLSNLDMNSRGRSARQNVDMLVLKVRNAMVRNHTAEGEKAQRDLDGKIGFIKALTDLDDWLRVSVAREDRSEILENKLSALAHALPFGAYLPTAVERASENHRVLRLVLEETIVFNTARKCPFLLVAEVEALGDNTGPESQSGATRQMRSPSRLAKDAIEMVSSREFWKNPVKQLKEQRLSTGHSGITEVNLDDEDEEFGIVSEADLSKNGHTEGAKQKFSQERWEDMQERVRHSSPYGDRPNWQLASMFVKAGDDLRQQQLGVLFVSTFQKIFLEERVPVWLSPYKVIATGRTCGLLEPARNSDSIARIKERGGYDGIDQYFLEKFGPKNSKRYKRAQRNFLQSLAGYSIVSYLIKLHDRHNGNVLLDLHGHLLHIDFGFMLGFSHRLERSPFKLTGDFIQILGGPYSKTFQKFRRLMEKAYLAANKHHREIILLAELMSMGDSASECFAGGRRWVIDELRDRFRPGETTRKLKVHINDIIDWSMGNYTTRCYDRYQRCVNGIW